MPTPPLSDEKCREALEAFQKIGNKDGAARYLDLPSKTYRNRLKVAFERGMGPTDPVMPGFHITRVSTHQDAEGNVLHRSIQQKPEPGDEFSIPEGHAIKGVSAYLDADGRVVSQWIKTKEGERDPLWVAEKIKEAFEGFAPSAPVIATPDGDDDRMTVYIFADWHVGLFAYGKETGGPDWDLSIARDVILRTIHEVVETSPQSKHAIVLGLGDLLHADDARNQTARSSNILDVDTRYSKCIETVCDLLVEATTIIASKHENVEVTFKPGNHDENSTSGIRQALRMYWRDNPRITVDTSPDAFYWRRFGVNLIGGTHGDKTKAPELPLIMANRRKEDWAQTSTRHFHCGHIHHDTLKETGGVHVFSHRAPVAQDHYHASHGYLSGRSMKSYTYHRERGARGHTEVEIS